MQRQPVAGLNEAVALPAPVLFSSATTPFSQHLATSPDHGRTWQRLPGNPVIPNKRDSIASCHTDAGPPIAIKASEPLMLQSLTVYPMTTAKSR